MGGQKNRRRRWGRWGRIKKKLARKKKAPIKASFVGNKRTTTTAATTTGAGAREAGRVGGRGEGKKQIRGVGSIQVVLC